MALTGDDLLPVVLVLVSGDVSDRNLSAPGQPGAVARVPTGRPGPLARHSRRSRQLQHRFDAAVRCPQYGRDSGILARAKVYDGLVVVLGDERQAQQLREPDCELRSLLGVAAGRYPLPRSSAHAHG